jgi:hypothetical protein
VNFHSHSIKNNNAFYLPDTKVSIVMSEISLQ